MLSSLPSLLYLLFYSITEYALSIRRIKHIFISSPFIYQNQDVRNPLWRDCVEREKTFSECYHSNGKNLNTLIQQGLNKNFFTRERWLDIDFISSELKLSLEDFQKNLTSTTYNVRSGVLKALKRNYGAGICLKLAHCRDSRRNIRK